MKLLITLLISIMAAHISGVYAKTALTIPEIKQGEALTGAVVLPKKKFAKKEHQTIAVKQEKQNANIDEQISVSSVEQIVRQAAIKHDLDPDWFVRLAICESSMNPNNVNYNYYENGFPSGLFQHISGYWPARAAQYGYKGASVFDPVANANVTAAMWRSGSHLWECQ